MSKKSTNTTLIILTILLCIVVIGLGAYTYSFYTEVKENETQLLKDKALVEAELDEEIIRYSKLLEEKGALSSQLVIAKERLVAFQQRIDSNEVTRSIVQQYQLELRRLRKERELLFKQNDSLQQETIRLSNLQKRTQNSLDSISKSREPIAVKQQVENAAQKLSKFSTSNIQAYGVIQRNSGKFVNTSRAARAQMIRVCYNVKAMDELPASKQKFYVKVIDENNKLIGIERKLTLDTGEQLSYNVETSIAYQNQAYKICELVLPIRPFAKGVYKIEIYDKLGRLATTQLTLK